MRSLKNKYLLSGFVTIILCHNTAADTLADPNNAALLYYQAFLSWPGHYTEISMPLEPSASGAIEPSQSLREYLQTCHDSIEFVRAAAQIPQCDWGLRYSMGDAVAVPHSMHIRQMAFTIKTQALVYAADQEYRLALEHCLLIHYMARHLGDENLVSYLVGGALSGLANKGIRQTLSVMPPERKTLKWLDEELKALTPGAGLINALRNEGNIQLQTFRLGKDRLIELAQRRCLGALSPERQARLSEADAAFLNASRDHFTGAVATQLALLERREPFETKYARLRQHDERVQSEEEINPHATFTVLFGTEIASLYDASMRLQTNHNALRNAVFIYRIQAEKGVMPGELPQDLPKDPISDRAFAFAKTEDGFILMGQAAIPGRSKPSVFSFTVK